MKHYLSCLFIIATLVGYTSTVLATATIISHRDIFKPVQAQQGMVVTDDPYASQIGLQVLQAGGNAIDAAVTIGFVMAVTNPRAGNIGGGGFMLIYAAEDKQVSALDYREKAPAAAHRDLFLTAESEVDTDKSRFSHLAAGVPGTVAGLAAALEKYGTLTLAEAIAPAVKLAREGFLMPGNLSEAIQRRQARFKQWPASQAVFLKPDGSFYQINERFKQPDLANTLQLIAEQGVTGFYAGKTADLIVAEMTAHNGLITHADLSAYQPVWREPIQGDYRGYQVYSMSPPSSGGVHIVQMLNMLAQHDLAATGHNSAATIHLMAEVMKRAYADRSRYLGDMDFVKVPLAGLTSLAYAQTLNKTLNLEHATPSSEIAPGVPPRDESPDTTHFSVVDKAGNAVANTYTLNFSFGSGIVVTGAGFLLNNEMDDFSAKPGEPNAYGLIGGMANAIAPHKRMLSSMSPTLVMRDNKPFLITGSPGGARIISTTLQVILNVIDHQMNIQEAVNAVRVHHQWWPDRLRVEEGLSRDTQHMLAEKYGHHVEIKNAMGAAHSILVDTEQGILYGAGDPRRSGVAVGY